MLAADIEFSTNLSYMFGKLKQDDCDVIREEYKDHENEFNLLN